MDEEKKSMKRRSFVKGLSAWLLASGAAVQAQAFSGKIPGRDEEDQRYVGQEGKRFGMVVDLRKCVGCQACTGACKVENKTPRHHFRTWVAEYERGEYPAVHKVFLPQLCNHCASPSCVKVCPTGATFSRGDGVVMVDDKVCWGCGYCVNACPYDKRYFHPQSKTVDKCTLCAHRLDSGLLPACVESCVGGARVAGDLNDKKSQVSRLLAGFSTAVLQPSQGNRPQVYYIGLDGSVQNQVRGTVNLDDLARMRDGKPRREWQTAYK
ncbi:sulfate reduction electron transfer complex DsrMKJOP subunit DsrO [Desulfurispira natronophila]|uniref:Tetrathionate reductase subunit B n=1 Tax=Desulfurispira natronophila TaxID=682562 RepID=A0A7W7Y321_9BACT|nr:4Fe-4S dicluster domain-containing protein [Desulfurispira natronophila]MBB5021175.1 tetrathionate reductase subunit B [Desulfurispira natronophila]